MYIFHVKVISPTDGIQANVAFKMYFVNFLIMNLVKSIQRKIASGQILIEVVFKKRLFMALSSTILQQWCMATRERYFRIPWDIALLWASILGWNGHIV